jgi:hypothetical protein
MRAWGMERGKSPRASAARLIPASFWLFAPVLNAYVCFLNHDANDVNKKD